MSTPLRDLRTGITDSIHAALEARAAASGTDMQTVAREVLADWAAREHRGYMVYARRLASNGLQTELPGFGTEDDGTLQMRKGRRA